MGVLTTTFELPSWIASGLASGTYERVGGVIRNSSTKQVIAWLREVNFSGINSVGVPVVDPITGIVKLATSLLNAHVQHRGFKSINQRLDLITSQLGSVQHQLILTSATSILSLGVSASGFLILNNRIDTLEKKLSGIQKNLAKIDNKIDISFYAKFKAALTLASNSFLMEDPENRRSSALSAINLFLEIENIFEKYIEIELKNKSNLIDNLLQGITIAYLSEVRCYLELNDFKNASRRLTTGSDLIKEKLIKYFEILLTKHPAAYLAKDSIELERLTYIFQWIGTYKNENEVFHALRKDLLNWSDKKLQAKWADGLPLAIVDRTKIKGSIWGNHLEMAKEAMRILPQKIILMESLIETHQRIESYQTEIEAIMNNNMTFRNWLLLSEQHKSQGTPGLLFIIPESIETVVKKSYGMSSTFS